MTQLVEKAIIDKKIINHVLCCFNKFFKHLFFKQLKKIKYGHLIIHFSGKSFNFGCSESKLQAELCIHDQRFFSNIVLRGELGFAHAYGQGFFSTTDLTNLLALFGKHMHSEAHMDVYFSKLFNFFRALKYFILEKNTIKNAVGHISQHYDLSNDLFELFLDKNMQYSAAKFEKATDSLDQAQQNKMQLITERLQLHKNDHVLEIGSGWGGLAIFCAKKYACKVTTITISKEQFRFVKNKIETENLSHLVDVKLTDYRNTTGQYDKIVSIEMIEAVGEQYYQTYFDQCSHLLRPGGLFLMQAILIADHEYNRTKNSVDFIKHYIFPASNIPSLNRLNIAANFSNFFLIDFNDMTPSYSKTLACWQEKFNNQRSKLNEMNFDNYFINIWNYYFSYCQAGFNIKRVRSAHLLFEKL